MRIEASQSKKKKPIDIEGIIVEEGKTDPGQLDDTIGLEVAYFQGFIGQDLYANIKVKCNKSNGANQTDDCKQSLTKYKKIKQDLNEKKAQ